MIGDVLLTNIGYVIQLSLAPAFLLTGIAGILNVMAGRLARIIDRGRRLSEDLSESVTLNNHYPEEMYLERRRYLASSAITACTLAALLVCLVIAVLFIKFMLALDMQWVVASLFIAATLALVVGLSYFLREVHLATQTVRIVLPNQDRNGKVLNRVFSSKKVIRNTDTRI